MYNGGGLCVCVGGDVNKCYLNIVQAQRGGVVGSVAWLEGSPVYLLYTITRALMYAWIPGNWDSW